MIISMLIDLTLAVLAIAAFIVLAYSTNQVIKRLERLSDPEQDQSEAELEPLLGVVYPQELKSKRKTSYKND